MNLEGLRAAALIATIPVRDRARTQTFYVETLGLRLESISEAGVLLGAGDGRVLLYERNAPAPEHTLAGFEISALAPMIALLESRGVSFEDYDFPGPRTVDHIAWIGPERAAWFRDSEGNILSISEPWRDPKPSKQD